MNLDIGTSESISFFVEGQNEVHLSGFIYWFSAEDDYSDDDEEAAMYDSSDEEIDSDEEGTATVMRAILNAHNEDGNERIYLNLFDERIAAELMLLFS